MRFILMLICLPVMALAGDYQKPEATTFVRTSDNALQTANVEYRPIDGSRLRVTLYSAVHVGDEAYYAQLNRFFSKHEVVLFELANDPDVLNQIGEREPSMLSMFQMNMGETLGLADQLEEIDYSPRNFVHADIPFEELLQYAQRQGDDAFVLVGQTAIDLYRMMNQDAPVLQTNQSTGLEMFFGMNSDPQQMKRDLAQQLVSEGQGGMLEGITVLNRYLIDARNSRVAEVLDEQIARGKTDIAIFYGAAHNPDFHRRLLVDYGLKPTKTTWVDAWDFNAPIKPRSTDVREMSDQELLMHLIERMMQEN